MQFTQLATALYLLVNVVKKLLSHKSRTSDDDSLHYVKVNVSQYSLEDLQIYRLRLRHQHLRIEVSHLIIKLHKAFLMLTTISASFSRNIDIDL